MQASINNKINVAEEAIDGKINKSIKEFTANVLSRVTAIKGNM